MPIIFSIANQKGGVGKTTTAITLGHGLARLGHRTLLVDLDPQGHDNHMFGLPKNPGLRRWYYDGEPLSQVIAEVRPNLHILPSDKSTERVRSKIKDEPYGEEAFGNSLKEQTARLFDVVLLDLAPGLDVLHLAGLVASDYVIIPTRLRFMELDGVSEIMRSVQEIKRHGHVIRGVYLLPTFFDRTTRETIIRLKELVDAFPSMVWPPIVNDIRVAEAPAYGKTLWEYAPDCNALLGYHSRDGDQRLGGYNDTLSRVNALLEEL